MIANITYKSVLAKYRDVLKRNKAFNDLDKQSQRMEIAWEALKLLLNGKIEGAGRKYTSMYWGNRLDNLAKGTPLEFQKKLIEKVDDFKTPCEVCAKGACMLAQIRLGNEVDPKNDDYSSGHSIYIPFNGENKSIAKGFSRKVFDRMESIYETSPREDRDYKLGNMLCNILVNGNYKAGDKTQYISK